MRALSVVTLALLLALAPATASAVTVDQIVALSKAGVSEPIILALIDRDKSVFTIDPEQLVALQRQGLSETIILAMLKSGREEGEAAANAASAFNEAAIMSTLSPYPDIVVVGHGPQRPNTGYRGDFQYGPPVYDSFVLPVPYGVPYSPYGSPGFRGSRRPPRVQSSRPYSSSVSPLTLPPGFCVEHPTMTAPPGVGSRGFITVCR